MGKSSVSGEHEVRLSETAASQRGHIHPDAALFRLAKEVGRLVDVVQEELRTVRRTLYGCILLVLVSAAINWVTIREVSLRLEVSPSDVRADVEGVAEAVEILRQNQGKIDRLLAANSKTKRAETEALTALVEAQAADVERDPRVRDERKKAAAERAQRATKAAKQVFRSEVDPLINRP